MLRWLYRLWLHLFRSPRHISRYEVSAAVREGEREYRRARVRRK